MEALLSGLKAVAENTRLRILFALSHGELNVTELTHILDQSQPRVSRHLKLMLDADLIERHKEGNWVLFRLREEGVGAALSRALVDMLLAHDEVLAQDLSRFEAVRLQRQELAAAYFKANAANWASLRSLHVEEADVEAAMLAMIGDRHFENHVDLGTGTGRMMELFSTRAGNLFGLDSSRDMLAVARANLEKAGLRQGQVRHGDIYALPFADGFADLVTMHQVLHFLDDPARAIAEARRILAPGGLLMITDFAPHNLEDLRSLHAHRRLGFSPEQIKAMTERAGFAALDMHLLSPPPAKAQDGLTVYIWVAKAPGEPAKRHHVERMTA